MGCEHYVGGIMFSEMNDDIRCLCTFPYNDGDVLDVERVRSLAYLGAAVVLEHRGDLEHPYLPACLPEWIRNEIDRNLGLPNGADGIRPTDWMVHAMESIFGVECGMRENDRGKVAKSADDLVKAADSIRKNILVMMDGDGFDS